MTIRKSFGFVLGSLVILGACSATVTLRIVGEQASDALVVNLTGRQRALTQRMARLAISYTHDGTKEDLNELEATLKESTSLLSALVDGGTVTYGGSALVVPPLRDEEIEAQLRQVRVERARFLAAVEKTIGSIPPTETRHEHSLEVAHLADTLFAAIDHVVFLRERSAAARVDRLRRFQLLFVGMGALVTVIGVWLIRGQMIAPLTSLDAAVRRITAGDLDTPITVSVGNEIRSVAGVLDGMRQQLRENRDRQSVLLKLSRDLQGQLKVNGILERGALVAKQLARADFAQIEPVTTPGFDEVSATNVDAGRTVSQIAETEPGASLEIPMTVGNRLVGRMRLRRSDAFTSDEERVGTLVASHIAMAYERARLHESALERLSRITALHEIDVAIASEVKLTRRLHVLLRQVTERLKVDAAAVVLLDQETGSLSYAARRGLDRSFFPDGAYDEVDSVVGTVAHTGESVFIQDVSQEPRFLRRAAAAALGIRSYVGVPLRTRRGTIGVLELVCRESRSFPSEEIDFIETLAGQAAVAIENAQLIGELQMCRDAFYCTTDGIAVTDTEGRIVRVNPAFVHVSGYPLSELIGQTPEIIRSTHTTDETIRELWQSVRSRGSWNGEVINRRKNGEEWLCAASVSTIYDEQGDAIGYIGVHRDITDVRKNLETIRRGKMEWEAAFDAVGSLIFVTDTRGVISRCNRSVIERLSCQYAHVIGKRFEDLLEEESDLLGEKDRDPSDAPRRIEKHFRNVDGLFRADKFPIQLGKGQLAGYVHVITDVTREKRMEAEREWLFEAIENAAEAVVVLTPNGMVRHANRTFPEVSGWALHEMEGRRLFHWVPDGHDVGLSSLRIALDAKETWSGDVFVPTRDRTIRCLSASVSHLRDESGSISGSVVWMTDVTEARALQERSERMREVERLGRLVGGVAHEVRNPLNAIQATVQVLQRDLGENDDLRPFFGVVQDQVDRLSNLMRDLLDLGKPIQRDSMCRLEIGHFVRDTCGLWAGAHTDHGSGVRVHTPPAEEITILGDRPRLQQVLINLLDNALQCSDEPDIRVHVDRVGRECRVIVRDGGSGVPEEHLARVFDPFFTLRRGGTGIGLSIVKHIVEAHGGSVSLRNNTPEPGCTVELKFPVSHDAS